LAGLGNLPDTIMNRSIVVRMRRRAPNEQISPYRPRTQGAEGHKLRDHLALWAAAIAGRITVPEMPDEIQDRDADNWEPILAIADAAGDHWPDTARVTAVTLVTHFRRYAEEQSLGIKLLADMRMVLNEPAKFTKTILDELQKLDESPWVDMRGNPLTDRELARRLRKYEIRSTSVRIGNATAKGYRREDFVDAWARYLPLPTPGKA
jgi:hypothetical protein